MQKWKTDPNLKDCPRDKNNCKKLDYYKTYVNEFLSSDPVRDWESIDRCIELWEFFELKANPDLNLRILDCGTKDGQFTEYLNEQHHDAIGIEIDPNYIEYAQSKNRPVEKGDICNIHFDDNTFDVVYAHHVMGLCPDYKKAIQEMIRVSIDYVVFLNQVPGNPNKHFSLVRSHLEIERMLKECPDHDIIYFDYWRKGQKAMEDELVVILRKD